MVLREKALVTTASGMALDLLNPNPADIRIEDIAHQLAQQPRFAGATEIFWSVAQHSLMVARSCPENERLWGLLHDAAEAFLSDLVAPIKRHLREYIVTEGIMMRAICSRFGLTWPEPAVVKEIDREICELEKSALLKGATLELRRVRGFDEVHWKVAAESFLQVFEKYKVESAEALRMLSLAGWTTAAKDSTHIVMMHPEHRNTIRVTHPSRTIPPEICMQVRAALQSDVFGRVL